MRTVSRFLSDFSRGGRRRRPWRMDQFGRSSRAEGVSVASHLIDSLRDLTVRRAWGGDQGGGDPPRDSAVGTYPVGRESEGEGEVLALSAASVHGSSDAMTTTRWLEAGATPRGNPATRRARSRRPAILLILAALALSETGCQSGFFGPCGTCRSGLRSFGERVFRPFRRTTVSQPCCGGEVPLGVETLGPLQYGTPSVVVPESSPLSTIPSTTIPSTTIPNGTISTPSSSAIEPLPSSLEPIPSAKPGPAPAAEGAELAPREGARARGGRANYEAYRPPFPDEPTRSSRLDSSKTSSPESTERSARGSARSGEAEEPNPLDNLPPLDIPKDLSRTGHADPSRALAERVPAASPTTDVGLTEFSGLPIPASITIAPGIRRFAGVESKLAGGSLPNTEGLDWLAEKGYKTILDLREENEISPSFISEVARRGMRYVALPVTLATVDSDHIKRFRFEIGLADFRPLYFFDTDGNRAGMLWYIQRVTTDGVDAQVARKDAEELGLTDSRFVEAARNFVNSTRPAPAPAISPDPAKPAGKPAAPAPAADPVSQSESLKVVQDQGTPIVSSPTPAEAKAAAEVTSWKALIPLFVTILGLPLAYISRSLFPGQRVSRAARASLVGSARSQRSLPSSSGA